MNREFRSNCSITSALDILGDKWVLVIVKQMLIEDKVTFKDFMESEESVATNILSSKLKFLEEFGLITKSKLPNNKKTNLYFLTDTGLSLTPTILELALWADTNLRALHPTMNDPEAMEILRNDKNYYRTMLIEKHQQKRDKMLKML